MKKCLITGLIILLPLALTVAIIAFVVNFLTKPFTGIVSHFLAKTGFAQEGFLFLSPQQFLQVCSQIIILVCLFVIIWGLGLIARWYLVRWFIQIGEKILHKLPLINKIYKTSKEIITSILGHDKASFQQVVMVPFPGKEIQVIGFLSRKAPLACLETKKEDALTSVFVPTAPNPTTGFTCMYRQKEITLLDMKPEAAIKYIVSCGMVTPEEGGVKEDLDEAPEGEPIPAPILEKQKASDKDSEDA